MASTNIAIQIKRLADAANIIKQKTVQWGLVKDDNSKITSADKLDIQAEAISKINIAQVSSESVDAGKSITISAGYNPNIITIKGNSLDGQTIGTADSSEILRGETAWVNGEKITGELDVNHYYTGNDVPNDEIGKDGDFYLVM